MNSGAMILALWIAGGFSVFAAEAPLGLNDYLSQVQTKHRGFRAAALSSDGARLYLEEAKLTFRPTFTASAEYSDDKKPSPLFSAFTGGGAQYGGLLQRTYRAGITEQTPYGIKASLNYQAQSIFYRGFGPEVYTASPVLDFTASLWKNFFGREIVAHVEAQLALDKYKELSQTAATHGVLLDAENNYWKLALARESLSIAQAAVARGERLFKFSQNRVHLQLVDKSESLQSEANLKARQLELKKATDDLRAASVAFNMGRGEVNDTVQEMLSPLEPKTFEQMRVPQRKGSKADVLAAEANARRAHYEALENRERYKPTLDLYGSYAFNSQEQRFNTALGYSFSDRFPTKMVGVRLSVPLDFGLISDVQKGYEAEAHAQDLAWEQKQIEQEREWHDLEKQFAETKEKLAMIISLEQIQSEKLSFEKDRHSRGRTTLFQVLTFENDLYLAQEQRVRTLTELLNIISKMKLYGGRT